LIDMADPEEVAKLSQAFRHCADLVRLNDKDRFLASLFAPAEQRIFLFALYAFDIETARVRDLVHEPMAGNIRLQWWHEAMAGLRPGEADAHPVLTALLHAVDIAAGGDRTLLTRAVEARQAELFGEPAVEAATSIVLMAVKLLGVDSAALTDVAQDAGRAMTFVNDPRDVDQARAAYEAFREKFPHVPAKARPAFLHLATVPLWLRLEAPPQWWRQIALMRAAWFGFPKR
jgi:phytoene/squalene synthetase